MVTGADRATEKASLETIFSVGRSVVVVVLVVVSCGVLAIWDQGGD